MTIEGGSIMCLMHTSTREEGAMPAGEDRSRLLTVADIQAMEGEPITLDEHVQLATEMRGRPVSRGTVRTYARESQPTPPGNRRKNRFEDNPMPLPYYIGNSKWGKSPIWLRADEGKLREWWGAWLNNDSDRQ